MVNFNPEDLVSHDGMAAIIKNGKEKLQKLYNIKNKKGYDWLK